MCRFQQHLLRQRALQGVVPLALGPAIALRHVRNSAVVPRQRYVVRQSKAKLPRQETVSEVVVCPYWISAGRLTLELSDAGGPTRRHWQQTRLARVRSSD